ncbi:MAG: xanthan lyase, partial [Phocaeicola sp.]|nr:xanthan lyase [Phocaeicola sp.]
MKKIYIQLLLMLCVSLNVYGQATEQNIEQRLRSYFSNYKNEQANIGRSQLKSFDIDYNRRKITIYANDTFGYQPFTESSVKSIYAQVKQLLPGPVNYFDLTIYADGKPIEHLIPNLYKKQAITDKIYDKKHYKSTVAWVENISRPIEIKQGLQNKHIALWQSHGRYFAQDRGTWKWQRPRLFGTTEDLLTQVFVVPYIIPMLENAGA